MASPCRASIVSRSRNSIISHFSITQLRRNPHALPSRCRKSLQNRCVRRSRSRSPTPAVNAALTDIQSSQRQHTIVLAALTQSSETQGADLKAQQADLKRISRQLSTLAVQVEALAPPLTTSSIPRMAGSIPRMHPRARILRASRKTEPKAEPKTEPALPPPVGPVSVGGVRWPLRRRLPCRRRSRSPAQNSSSRDVRSAQLRSNPSLPGSGLLRGACHRARIRATRWLAMTLTPSPTPQTLPHSPDASATGQGGSRRCRRTPTKCAARRAGAARRCRDRGCRSRRLPAASP